MKDVIQGNFTVLKVLVCFDTLRCADFLAGRYTGERNICVPSLFPALSCQEVTDDEVLDASCLLDVLRMYRWQIDLTCILPKLQPLPLPSSIMFYFFFFFIALSTCRHTAQFTYLLFSVCRPSLEGKLHTAV